MLNVSVPLSLEYSKWDHLTESEFFLVAFNFIIYRMPLILANSTFSANRSSPQRLCVSFNPLHSSHGRTISNSAENLLMVSRTPALNTTCSRDNKNTADCKNILVKYIIEM